MKNTLGVIFLFLLLGILAFFLESCTDNQRARNFGGNETITMLPNERFINVTWKQNNIWIITEDTVAGCFYATEKSSWGLMEGRIIIKK